MEGSQKPGQKPQVILACFVFWIQFRVNTATVLLTYIVVDFYGKGSELQEMLGMSSYHSGVDFKA